MEKINYQLLPANIKPQLGLIVLQSDVTIEDEFRYYFGAHSSSLLASRIPFENEVTPETLKQMRLHLSTTVDLFPLTTQFDAIGYACTSGALHIGSERIKQLVQQQRPCKQVTNPMQAAVTALQHIKARNIAYLAPYSEHVSQTMIDEFQRSGFTVVDAATYDENQDANVGRISPDSIYQSAIELCQQATTEQPIDALFIACTNMKCADIIPKIEAATGVYTLSSNLVLAWDMARLAGLELSRPTANNTASNTNFGRLCQ